MPRRFRRPARLGALGEDLDGGLMRIVRRRNPTVERHQQQDLANLLRRAAIFQRAAQMHAQLRSVSGRRHHGDHGEAFCCERDLRQLPHVAIGIGIDDVLQWRAEVAERAHAFVDRLRTEHLAAKL
jgi:hypothetical protein